MAHDAPVERDLLIAAAEAAGRVTMRYFKTDLDIRQKDDDEGPVTAADEAADALLKQQLRGARPGYGWMSEESADDAGRLNAERVFIVDPIDGTRSFIAGEPSFAVSVGLAEAGRMIAAAVHMPARGETYAAALGAGATRDGAPIRAAERTELAGATVLAARPQMRAELWPGGVPPVERSFRSSLAWRLCLVGAGRFDAMVTLRDAWEWDIAAGSLIAAEAGATVSDGQGAVLRFNRPERQNPGVIAAGSAVHRALIARRRA